jgi:hypothetical protein
VSIDASQLVSSSNLARTTLEREVELDVDAAILELVESGKGLHGALAAAEEDADFWHRLEKESLNSVLEATEHAEGFAVFAGAHHVAVLEVLGYQPPPPAQELVDDAVEALHVLSALSHEPFARTEQIAQAREGLRIFNARLLELLYERGAMPKVLRRSLLRRALRRGATVAVVIAPLALAYGAQAAAVAIGLPGDAVKDVTQALAGAAATWIARTLPEAGVSEVEAAAILSEIDTQARVRALASVVQIRLLRLEVEQGIDDAAFDAMIGAAKKLVSVARWHLRSTVDYSESLETFVTAVNTLREHPSEQNLGSALRAWTAVQAKLDQMELQPSDFESRLQKLELEQQRREAAERTLQEAHQQPVAEGQTDQEREANERFAAERADQARRKQLAKRKAEEEAEAQRKAAQRTMTLGQGQ